MRKYLLPGVVFVGSLLAVSLTGCTGAGAGNDNAHVVATTTQVADFARNVLGGQLTVDQLLQPGQSAHSFDPSAAQLLSVRDAEAVIENGVGLETWLAKTLSAAGTSTPPIDASVGVAVSDDDAHDAGSSPESPSAEPSQHQANPHVWTDVRRAEQMVQNISAGLQGLPTIDRTALEQNTRNYLAKLNALDGWIRANIDPVPAEQRLLVSNHDAFGYFVGSYGITYVGSIIPSFEDNAEPSAAQIEELVEKIKQTGVRAVFSETSISPKAADAIATAAGVTVYSGDDALYGDSLGAPGSDGASYIGSQVHNVRRILESWGVTATPLPPELQE